MTMQLQPGTKLGPYEILAPLGAGGMGEVYRAQDPRLSREVALKVLPQQFTGDPERMRRFEQEARAAGMLNHPNILTIYDIGSLNGNVYPGYIVFFNDLAQSAASIPPLFEQGLTPPASVREVFSL